MKTIKDMLSLNLGCGYYRSAHGCTVGLDIQAEVSPNIVADAGMLPFRDEVFDYIYSSHLIEHFSHNDAAKVLAGWVRVLKRGGTIEIRCPDLRARAFLFFLFPTRENLRKIYGGQTSFQDQHRGGFSSGLLKKSPEANGIRSIKRVITGYKGIPFIPDSLQVKGCKP